MKTRCALKKDIFTFTLLLTMFLSCGMVLAAAPETSVSSLFTLSDFSGPVTYGSSVRLSVDSRMGEVFVLDLKESDIRIFNRVGMEVYRTGSYRDLGSPVDLAIRENGNIDLLVKESGRYTVLSCDYRGEPVSKMEFSGIPEGFQEMRPDKILWNRGLLYLVDADSLRVAVFDAAGRYVRGYALADLLGMDETKAPENAMFGFTVDGEGNLFFTIPTLFSVYRVSPDGRVETFGEAGSSPGKFSIVSGIAVDSHGYIYLSDRNRSVVMIYGPDLKFRHEFGYRGAGRDNLIVPRDLGIDSEGTVYVTQMGNRGIKAFRVSLAP